MTLPGLMLLSCCAALREADSPSSALAAELASAAALRKAGDNAGAEAAYAALGAKYPERAEPWFFLGLMARADDRPAEAISAYRTALQRDAHLAEAHMNLASLLSAEGGRQSSAPVDVPLSCSGKPADDVPCGVRESVA